MIVTDPPASRYESTDTNVSNDEHLLERISALENRLSRLTEKLERGLDLLLRQAQNSYFDRALLKSLIGLLTDDGVVQSDRLERLWNDRCQKDAEEQQESARREEVRVKILASYKGREREAFEQAVNEGFLLIEDRQQGRGIRSLQRAASLGRDSSELVAFVGEHFFRAGKTKLAREYLTRAHKSAPLDMRVSLLLGLTCADEGDTDRAKELLSGLNRRGGSSFAVHYGLGRLFVAEQKWQKAIAEFKRALAIRPSPEAHYAIAYLYYSLSRDSLALRHLNRAIEMDGDYHEAFHLLGLTYQRVGQEKMAEEAFKRARSAEVGGGKRSRRSRSATGQEPPPLSRKPVFGGRKLMTGGDRRLAEVLRQDALRGFPPD